jgi:protein-tyrosine-phosphatase/predicted ATP-grasp superfamily ATP-dependent carboligase
MGRSGRVLALGSDTRSFLSVIRSLGRSGLEVHVAWSALNSPSLRSRYVRAVHCIPYYRSDDSRWIDTFNNLLYRYEFDLVIPCDDASLLPLQTHEAQLARRDSIYLLSERAYRITSDKECTYALARELGISLPRQAMLSTSEELHAAVREFAFPVVVKPPRSAESSDPQLRRSVKKIRNSEDLHSLAIPMLAAGPVLVQEHFSGIGVGVETLCRNGEVLVAFQHERVHEPLLGGGSSYRRSVPLNPDLLQATRQVIEATKYTGVCMVEFRYNPKSHKWILIEMNGRFWGSLPLALAAGVDFPRYLYEMLKHDKREFASSYRANIFCRNWLIDAAWLRSNIRADKTDPTLSTLPLHRVLAEIRNLFLFREHSDTFTLDDPAPAVEEFARVFARLWVPMLWRLNPFRQRTRHRVIESLRKASSVLFLCKGNICRSPFAEICMRSRLPNLTVSSAGLLPASGRCSPPSAIEAAANRDIDLSQHRSRVLTDEDILSADVIFVFDVDQFRALTRFACLKPPGKVFFLASLEAGGRLEIGDPIGRDLQTFEATYDRIARLVDRAAAVVSTTAGSGHPG